MRWKGRTVAALVLGTAVLSSTLTLTAVEGVQAVTRLFSSPVSDADFSTRSDAGQASPNGEGLPPSFGKIVQTYRLIQRHYLETVADEKLVNGAIEGMLEALDDPYTSYLDEEATQHLEDAVEGSFEGIGAEVKMENGRVTVVAPIKGSPAEKAGLRPNDQILRVNGESLEGLSLMEAVLKIRGPKGTPARLEIIRPGVPQPLELVIIRDEIPIETVYADIIKKQGIPFGRIEITQFSAGTSKRFAEELKRLEEAGIKGLVIDLRGNPGGLLEGVLEMAKQVVPHHGVILHIEQRGGQRETYRSTLEGRKPYPIVVLVDEGSASAAEIFAAALQESGGYTVVGKPSFGKGTVQQTVDLADKSTVKLTVAKWLTPKGHWVNKKGVQPDIVVDQPAYFKAVPLPKDRPLRHDMNHVDVHNLQVMLQGIGYPPGRTDGYFDVQTEQAVKAFQRVHGLPVTGVVDAQTATRIEDELRKRLENPENDLQLQTALQVLVKQASP
ncbi:MAG TPA: S41 family peptidase [Calditerricola sp.]